MSIFSPPRPLTDHQKGELALDLSIDALLKLRRLLEDERPSANEKATYYQALGAGKERYDQYDPSSPSQNALLIRTPPICRAKKISDQLLAQKGSFSYFLNFIVRQSDIERLYEISCQNLRIIRVSCMMNISELQLNRKTDNIKRD